MSLPVWRRCIRDILLILLIAVIYFISGKVGLQWAFLHASATPVWPPTGIALAALLLLGYRVWPGIFLGAFLVNLTTAGNITTSLGIAVGNTLEGIIGAYLVSGFANGLKCFERPVNIFKFAFLAGVVSPLVSATFGVTSLSLAGFAPWTNYTSIWFTWWLGDMGGALITAPFFILWISNRKFKLQLSRFIEALIAIAALLGFSFAVFGGGLSFSINHYPLEFLTIPVLIFVAFRFGQRETALSSLILAAIATWGTIAGFGPFAVTDKNTSLLLLQVFLSISAMTALFLAAAVAERKRMREELGKSEQHYRALIEHSSDAVTLVDQAGKVLYSSPSTTQVLGYAPQELIGRQGFDLIHPDDRLNTMKELAKVVKNPGMVNRIESRVHHKDGSWRWIESWGTNLLENPAVGAVVVNYRDITERKRVEQKLKEHTNQLEHISAKIEQEKAKDEALLSSIGDGVIVTDAQGVITFINTQAEILLGYQVAEALDKRFFDLVVAETETGEHIPRHDHPFQLALTSGKTVSAKYYYLRRDKSRFPVTITAAPVVLGGKIVGAIDVFRDITSEEEVDRMKTEFIALAAHQLRAPLSNMRWNVELLLQKSKLAFSDEIVQKFTQILTSTKQMIVQVSDLINAAQILQGKVVNRPEKIGFSQVVESEISESDSARKQKGVTIAFSEASPLPPLYIDPEKLHDVVENLLTNALKFNLPNGHITVSLNLVNARVHLTVADTGIGIPQSEHDSIFTKFFRASNASDIEGTGLGLFLVKSYVQRWDGKVWFESPDPNTQTGTVFHIEIPLSKVSKKLFPKLAKL